MKYNIITLGCKVNSYESEHIGERLREAGYEEVSLKDSPDVVVVNTCSVTNQSDAKSRHFIRMARRMCPDATLVVCGCSAQNHREELLDLDIDILIGNKDKSKIVDLIKEHDKSQKRFVKFYDLVDVPFEDMLLKNKENRTRAFVKIQDGCDNFCSYCIIPYLRGNKRNKDIKTATKEIETLVAMGHKEIVLTGIHTGSYGYNEDYDLVDLIRQISKFDGLKRIRISSIEITELSERFMEELANNDLLCDHMHIPLQSGSDRILSYMNRKYDTKYYREKIEELRRIRPNMSITTDLIVGFPNETEEDFEDTLKFLKEMRFTKIHTFPFSLRSGTKAEEMMNHAVSEKDKTVRVHRVLELSRHLEEEYYKLFIGKTLEMIVESSKDGLSKGHTSNYILVEAEGTLEEGSLVKVKITGVDDGTVNGIQENVE